MKFEKYDFAWTNYIILISLFVISTLIGLYYAYFGQKTSEEYLMGSRKLKVFPIVISTLASHFSSTNLLGIPAEIYRYGAAFWLIVISNALIPIIFLNFYLPVYYNLQIVSIYEYLEMRFDKKTRLLASIFSCITLFLTMPIMIYAPTLAFCEVTGINFNITIIISSVICIFYTTIGGLKGVVFADTFQFLLTLSSLGVIIAIGITETGGIFNIWKIAKDGKRLDIFDFQPGFGKRDDFWAVVLGNLVLWCSASNKQDFMQKFKALSTYESAKLAFIFVSFGLIIVKTSCVLLGLIIYAKYAHCDPISTKKIAKLDQIMPHYVMETVGSIPGIPGLFIGGIYSAAFAGISARLNCLSGQVYEDFLLYKWPNLVRLSETRKRLILKLIVLISGAIMTGMVFVYKQASGLIALNMTVYGFVGGPLFGLFTLGVMTRKANAKGAFYGGILGMMIVACWLAPIQYFKMMDMITFPIKPIYTDECGSSMNQTSVLNVNKKNQVAAIFQISHYYTSCIGFVSTILIGLLISQFSSNTLVDVDEKLLAPCIRNNEKNDKDGNIDHNNQKVALLTSA